MERWVRNPVSPACKGSDGLLALLLAVKIILFGATGMVGAGVLREALADGAVDAILSIGRRPCGVTHPKLRELVLPDLFDFAGVEPELVGWDACIWAVGISWIGLDEAMSTRVTET